MNKLYCVKCAAPSRWHFEDGKLLCLKCLSVGTEYFGDMTGLLGRLARERRTNWKELSRVQIDHQIKVDFN